ncbi:hypothetical protein [Aeromonas salmonicida]|uniref:hypothetical protein n=1 Tax=Aeromonas salmonicida TaxID=645 RepID=UPI00283A9F6C|nr:hypothetical protein [Aeromonas salmonicida]
MLDNKPYQTYIDALAMFFPEIGKYKDLPPSIFLFFLAAAAFIKVIHKINIIDLTQTYDSLRKRKFHEIRERLADKKKSDDSYFPLKNQIETYDFKLATGIYAESLRRKDLIHIHSINQRVNTWKRIKLALSFIDEDATIRDFTKCEKLERKLFSLLGRCCEFFAMICLALTGIVGLFSLSTIYQELLWLGYTVLFALCGIFFHRQNWPYISAEIIKKQIAQSEEANSNASLESPPTI